MMSELIRIKVGFADIEEFNLGLKWNLKNLTSTKISEMQDKKIVKVTMEVKMCVEPVTKRKRIRARNKARSDTSKLLGMNSKTYRTTIRGFRDAALARKVEYRDKYDKKLEHLKFKYREDEQEKMDKIPDEMQEYVSLSIFDREKYDRLEIRSYEVTCVGDLNLSNEEKTILTMHSKFCLLETLHEGSLEFEQELAYAKLRMQIQKELGEKLDEAEEVEVTPEERELMRKRMQNPGGHLTQWERSLTLESEGSRTCKSAAE